jgi:hypothetical protein
MKRTQLTVVCSALCILSGCSRPAPKEQIATAQFFKVDPATAGTLKGVVRFAGKRPVRAAVDMSGDPACVEAHHGKAADQSVVVNPNGTLANVFVYIKTGLEGKQFETPATPVALDQRGCWFQPRVIGIRTGQGLEVTNADPVTHSIHPLAQINREWNHSQGPGEAPLERKFLRPEVMIRVKCNIHSWMRAYIGVVDHPYFAVTGPDGSFEIHNVPPGEYVLEAWQETLGTQEQKVSVTPASRIDLSYTFKGE